MKAAGALITGFVLSLMLTWGSATSEAQQIAVTSANPPAAAQGTVDLDVAIGGKGFKRGATASFLVSGTTNPGGITVNATRYVNASQLVANITVSDTAVVSSFDIQVQNSDGRTGKGIELFSVVAKGQKTDADPAIAYTDLPWDGRNQRLMVMNADGSHQRMVWNRGSNSMPDWSPDGSKLVFINYPNPTNGGLYIIGVDGEGLCQLVSFRNSSGGFPAWSPFPLADGRHWIVYASSENAAGGFDLFAVPAECNSSTKPVKLTDSPEMERFPSWSRFGTRLAVNLDARGGLAVYDVQFAEGAPRLANRVSFRDLGILLDAEILHPSWSRSDDRIYFSASQPWGSQYDLWVTDLTEAGTYPITSTTEMVGEMYPSTSPDGTELVFMDNRSSTSASQQEYGVSVWKLAYRPNSDGSGRWERTVRLVPPSSRYQYPRWRRCNPCP
jgi:Tol biopolymer transport system component